MPPPSTSMLAPWWELRLSVPDASADDLGALLISEGATGVEELNATCPSPALPRLDAIEQVATPAAGSSTLVAAFDGDMSEDDVVGAARRAVAQVGVTAPPAMLLRRRDDTDWAERWKQYFEPLACGDRIWVVPSWRRDFLPPAPSIAVRIDPGLAFGTGQHATTALCLEVMAAAFRAGAVPERVLDVGSGSGILAIAAVLMGSRDVLAIDNDPVAVQQSLENAALNGVAGPVRASEAPLAEVAERFDWVLANIIAPTLIELAADLIRTVASGGSLLLSGVLASQEAEVLAAFRERAAGAQRRAQLVDRRQRDEWVALRLTID